MDPDPNIHTKTVNTCYIRHTLYYGYPGWSIAMHRLSLAHLLWNLDSILLAHMLCPSFHKQLKSMLLIQNLQYIAYHQDIRHSFSPENLDPNSEIKNTLPPATEQSCHLCL